MNKKRDHKSSSPHAVAAVASMMVLLVGIAVGAYFVEIRGDGLNAMMSGVRAQEILMLFGGLAVCTLLTQFMVAGVARPSGSQKGNVRDMVRAVLDLDPGNPNAGRQLQSIPELHELATMIAAEKSAKLDAVHQLQELRREIGALLKGMERSAVTGDPLREEQASEVCAQLAGFWNAMLSNAAAPEASASPTQKTLGPGSPEPGVVHLDEASSAAAPFAAGAVVQRVERLEQALETLQRMVHDLAHTSSVSPAAAQDASLQPPGAPALFVPEPSADPPALEIPEPDPTREVGLGSVPQGHRDPEQGTASPSGYHEWNPQAHLTSAADTEGSDALPGLESSDFVAPAPEMGGDVPQAGALTVQDPTIAREQFADGVTAADSAFGAEPAFGVEPPHTDTAQAPARAANSAASTTQHEEKVPATAMPPDSSARETSTDAEADRDFAQQFPHFVGQPADNTEGQVEVTYDPDLQRSQASPEPTPRPQTPRQPLATEPAPEETVPEPSAPAVTSNPRRFPESQVIDLRSLGAVEFED